MEIDFLDVTELAEAHVTRQQVGRLLQRYSWAGQFCDGKDVLELACGNGMGLGYLSSVAKSLVGGDVSPTLVKRTNRHYGSRIDVRVMDAQNTGLIDASFDVIILFEAIYYLQEAESFIQESFRLLRPRGVVLIVTTNKDLYDFTPSLHSVAYYGVPELNNLLRTQGFDCEFYVMASKANAPNQGDRDEVPIDPENHEFQALSQANRLRETCGNALRDSFSANATNESH